MDIKLSQAYSFHQQGQRNNQEDSRYPDMDKPDLSTRCFLVCDGVGGSAKGEVASSTICKAFGEVLDNYDWTKDFTTKDFQQALTYACQELKKQENKENHDMATTLTFAAFHKKGCFVAHIGDSRIYHIRPSVGILYRSDDHSLVHALVHAGCITPDEVENHPQGNIITRCICLNDETQQVKATTMQITDLAAGDYLLLCSDGVLHQTNEEELLTLLRQECSDEAKMDCLANISRNSTDNNTAYMIPIADVTTDEQPSPEKLDNEEYSLPQTLILPRGEECVHEITPNTNPKSNLFKKFFSKFAK